MYADRVGKRIFPRFNEIVFVDKNKYCVMREEHLLFCSVCSAVPEVC